MVEEQEKAGSSFPWAPLLTALMASSGLLMLFPQINSSRPSVQNRSHHFPGYHDEDVDARLWQDPIAAVDEVADQGEGGNSHDYDNLILQINRALLPQTQNEIPSVVAEGPTNDEKEAAKTRLKTQVATGRGIHILAVMTPEGPYVEYAERRLRDREAVIQALGKAHFAPDATDHIGYIKLAWPLASNPQPTAPSEGGLASARKVKKNLLVPYEWYSQTHYETGQTFWRGKVLVLWLVDEAFQNKPLERLANLVHLVSRDQLPVSVIGPDNSSTLLRMVAEARTAKDCSAEPPDWRDFLKLTRIFSPKATAADSQITAPDDLRSKRHIEKGADAEASAASQSGENSQEVIEAGVRGHEVQEDCPPLFERTCLTDERIVSTMLEELARRGVQANRSSLNPFLPKPPHHIVIISELDSYYARSLTQTFTDQFNELAKTPADEESRLHRFVYLRGIDGKIPEMNKRPADETSGSDDSERRQKSPAGQSNKAEQSNRQRNRPEQTEGTDHADYLRRLADEIGELDAALYSEGGVRAIGVLGSDVYDKLELLEAVRAKVGHAVYFTNNLDARFSHSSEWSETRNLIVVSDFGLCLNKKWQQGVPPFRDSRQTAVFAAMLEAMEVIPRKARPEVTPRIFEIARSGPRDLSVDDVKGEGFHPARSDLGDPYTELTPVKIPGKEIVEPRRSWGIIIIALAASFCLALKIFYAVENPTSSARFSTWKRMASYGRRKGWSRATQFFILVLGPPVFRAFGGFFRSGRFSVWTRLWLHGRRKGWRGLLRTSKFPALYESSRWFLRQSLFWVPAMLLLSACLVYGDIYREQHLQMKPFAWADGISNWVPMALWIFAGFLSLHLLIKAHLELSLNGREIGERFGLRLDRRKLVFHRAMRRRYLLRLSLERRTDARMRMLGRKIRRFTALFGKMRPRILNGMISGRFLWLTYRRRGNILCRALRVGFMTTIYTVVTFCIPGLMKTLTSWPMRLPLNLDFMSLHTGFLMMFFFWVPVPIWLMFYVLDAVKLHESFLLILDQGTTGFPPNVCLRMIQDSDYRGNIRVARKEAMTTLPNVLIQENAADPQILRALEYEVFPDYIDILLIAQRTIAVSRLIYYPFVFIALWIIGCFPTFDAYSWDQIMLIRFAVPLGLALYGAFLLPRVAKRYRATVLDRLQTQLRRAIINDSRPLTETLRQVIGEITSLNEGAFVGIWEQPAVRAFLLPSGGIGIWTLFQLFLR